MIRVFDDEQPVAGPSSRPWDSHLTQLNSYNPLARLRTRIHCHLGDACPYLVQEGGGNGASRIPAIRSGTKQKRQGGGDPGQTPVASSAISSPSSPFATATVDASTGTSSTTSPAPLFGSPSFTVSSTGTGSQSGSYSETTFPTSSSSSSTSAGFSGRSSGTRSSLPWPTKSKPPASPSSAPFVAGTTFNLTLAGESDTQAVYAIPVAFGHMSGDQRRRDAYTTGSSAQVMNLQVDLGSSDIWLASQFCSSQDCKKGPALFNSTLSLASGVDAQLSYQSGSIAGDIYWEEMALGAYQIGYQAFIAASQVSNQDMSGGQYTGVLGFAFPGASVIQDEIPGTTTSDPDGATFLDNLFSSGSSAPSQRVFSLSLARREDVRTSSFLTIGTISSGLCPVPCSPGYLPIIPQAQLGPTGYLHWRLPLQGISYTTWADAKGGSGPTSNDIKLGPSIVDKSRASPLAVLDSGGTQILVGNRQYIDAIYSAFGVSMSTDGFYRMPCQQQIALTFTFGGKAYPLHPLDLTYPDPQDPSQNTCIGMIQYAPNLGDTGDFILGSAFLKNVYSIFQYPDQTKATSMQPSIGLVSLINASIASSDFYAVRTLKQPLSAVSASQIPVSGSGTSPSSPSPQPSSDAQGSGAVRSMAAIIAGSVVGFFFLAAAAFCLWWFFLRRKFGSRGIVAYRRDHKRREGNPSQYSNSTSRSRKHEDVQRQKSMVEGFSDYDDGERGSWISESLGGGESIRLGYLPEVPEEGEEGRKTRMVDSTRSSLRESSLRPPAVLEDDGEVPMDSTPKRRVGELGEEDLSQDPFASPAVARTTTAGRTASTSPTNRKDPQAGLHPDTGALAYGQPRPAGAGKRNQSAAKSTSMSLSMSGPFPSPLPPSSANPNRTSSSVRPDNSPMYDIRSSDYFQVPIQAPRGRKNDRDRQLSGGERGWSAGRSPGPPVMGLPLGSGDREAQ